MKINSEQEMIALGAQVTSELKTNVIELIGDVGAGKTTFVKGLAKGLGIKEPVTSPSFTISKSYSGQDKILIHYDFYRLSDPGIMQDDLRENLKDKNSIIVIEWSDSIKDILPQNHIIVKINLSDDGSREVKIS